MIAKLRNSWEKNWPEIHCAFSNGLPPFVLSSDPKPVSNGVPVFCYHVPDAKSFENDLCHLQRNGYHTLTADELLAYLNGTFEAPEKSVVLTFDDGPVDLYRVAFPLLQAYGFRGVAFVAPYFHDHAPIDVHESRACSWDELIEMNGSGVIDVQSHSYEHRRFPSWPEPAPLCGVTLGTNIAALPPERTLLEDLELARTTLEARLGKTVRHLGFPCYDGTPEAIAVGKDAGYEAFWWGTLPRVPVNRPARDAASRIVRVSGEFVRRLPGDGRLPLASILAARYQGSLARLLGANRKTLG
jgi:peptidoglycan/xylan/chitin deacetylase (PgdA/CDA1 family)